MVNTNKTKQQYIEINKTVRACLGPIIVSNDCPRNRRHSPPPPPRPLTRQRNVFCSIASTYSWQNFE